MLSTLLHIKSSNTETYGKRQCSFKQQLSVMSPVCRSVCWIWIQEVTRWTFKPGKKATFFIRERFLYQFNTNVHIWKKGNNESLRMTRCYGHHIALHAYSKKSSHKHICTV